MFVIELPGDEWGNRGYTNSQACVIEWETGWDADHPERARVLAPPRIATTWPTINAHPAWGMPHAEVQGPARDLTEQEYAQLVEAAGGAVRPWHVQAAKLRAGEEA